LSKLLAEPPLRRDIYTVSRLNREVRSVLEGSFPLLWIEGEISNLARPSSGHIYFSLKDSNAQVRCAMFRMKRQLLRFQPENGITVQVRARVGLYEGRGEFQLIIEHMEAGGEGALRQAFEALKLKLSTEGLFDTERKKTLPEIPQKVGVITSPSGAAVRDVLTVMARRFPSTPVLIYPVAVQGENASREIVEAIQLANRRRECDLLILTRGGGSLEDLMAFNEERVARAIADSTIPIISAVGHEIDFTIADFVADQRAPTPSAAAEVATPDGIELIQNVEQLHRRHYRQVKQQLEITRQRFLTLNQRLHRVHPESRLQQQTQLLDSLELRLKTAILRGIAQRRENLQLIDTQLGAVTPQYTLERQNHRIAQLLHRLSNAINKITDSRKQSLAVCVSKLNTLSPLATLERGYSITLGPSSKVIQSTSALSIGDKIETLLETGKVISRVEKVEP